MEPIRYFEIKNKLTNAIKVIVKTKELMTVDIEHLTKKTFVSPTNNISVSYLLDCISVSSLKECLGVLKENLQDLEKIINKKQIIKRELIAICKEIENTNANEINSQKIVQILNDKYKTKKKDKIINLKDITDVLTTLDKKISDNKKQLLLLYLLLNMEDILKIENDELKETEIIFYNTGLITNGNVKTTIVSLDTSRSSSEEDIVSEENVVSEEDIASETPVISPREAVYNAKSTRCFNEHGDL